MLVAYIAGPFRSTTYYGIWCNVGAAEQVALKYWKLGYAVICPHTNTANFDGAVPKENDKLWLDGDIEIMKRCDVVIAMTSWEKSSGAKAELEIAKNCGLKIIYDELGDGEPSPPRPSITVAAEQAGHYVTTVGPVFKTDSGAAQEVSPPDLCEECVISVIAGASWIPCAMPKKHDGLHRGKGNCFKHGEYMGEVGAFPQCPQWPKCIGGVEEVSPPSPEPEIDCEVRHVTHGDVRKCLAGDHSECESSTDLVEELRQAELGEEANAERADHWQGNHAEQVRRKRVQAEMLRETRRKLKQAEGDTRELKAALTEARGMLKIAARNLAFGSREAIREYLEKTERLLG